MHSLFVQSFLNDAQLSFQDGGKDEGLAGVIPVCAHAQVHLHRARVLLESLGDTKDGVRGAHCHICPVGGSPAKKALTKLYESSLIGYLAKEGAEQREGRLLVAAANIL